MSYIINNVECTGCDFFEFEAMYKRADGPDNCPQCGSKRKMSFKGFSFAIHGQGYGSFATAVSQPLKQSIQASVLRSAMRVRPQSRRALTSYGTGHTYNVRVTASTRRCLKRLLSTRIYVRANCAHKAD